MRIILTIICMIFLIACESFAKGDLSIRSDYDVTTLRSTTVVHDSEYPKYYTNLGMSYTSPYTGDIIHY